MSPNTIFYIIIGILLFDFLLGQVLDYLNFKHYDDKIPEELTDVYNETEYVKSQAYKKENYRFSVITSVFSFLALMAFLYWQGFAWLDQIARSFSSNELLVGMIFFGILFFINDILTTPFSYYQTFVIEEKYGFNKSTKKTFVMDKLKGWALTLLLGGLVLGLIIYFYSLTLDKFWIYTWILITLFTLFFTLFYSTLIVPIFNKQKPLEDGPLRSAIQEFAGSVGFSLKDIFVIDGSKRSTKANAYFAGFGPKKRIVLYDTLINDLTTNQIVAVLAHEIGHYKKRHVFWNMALSILITGFSLYILSLFIQNAALSDSLGVSIPSFHLGLIAFGILYSPISEITGILMQYISRKFEYQADDYAKTNYNSTDLIQALKKLSQKSFSNLTPHRAYVFFHYSHPPLLERVRNLDK